MPKARCSLCGLNVPARDFITRRKRIVVRVIYCPRCDVAKPKAKAP